MKLEELESTLREVGARLHAEHMPPRVVRQEMCAHEVCQKVVAMGYGINSSRVNTLEEMSKPISMFSPMQKALDRAEGAEARAEKAVDVLADFPDPVSPRFDKLLGPWLLKREAILNAADPDSGEQP